MLSFSFIGLDTHFLSILSLFNHNLPSPFTMIFKKYYSIFHCKFVMS